jgi:hypothetical protein
MEFCFPDAQRTIRNDDFETELKTISLRQESLDAERRIIGYISIWEPGMVHSSSIC